MALVASAIAFFSNDEPEYPLPPQPGIGDASALEARFEQWQAARNGAGEDSLSLGLGYVKGLSTRHTEARGELILDVIDGRLSARLSDATGEEALDLWLVDNLPAPGDSVRPEASDRMVRVGRIPLRNGEGHLETRLDATEVADFEIDLAVVTPAGVAPDAVALLVGAPSLFQKLRFGDADRIAGPPAGAGAAAEPALAGLFRGLVPRAYASNHVDGALERLVARGEELFFEETFDGNGRTCGTCHPAEHNFTIDPEFISRLPDNDPLFVAETNPDLAENFEDPGMMRKHGLILENVDGFGETPEDLETRFVLRGVPHTLGLPTSLLAEAGTRAEATGWSGDGAPGSGSLREFAIGAVTQHFPRTLDRMPGSDFRLPNDRELDALEAFQLSLGRQADIVIDDLALRNPAAANGKTLFIGDGRCNFCHLNGGGNAPVPGGSGAANRNFDTDVENLVPKRQRDRRPVDGGFDTTPGSIETGFGNGKFNTPTLIEAADTPPFFHNNTAETLEDAIAFYKSQTFRGSPISQQLGGLSISLNTIQIDEIGAFLRVLNALENIRSASVLAVRATETGTDQRAASLLVLAAAETNDGVGVLLDAMGGRGIHRTDAARNLIAASRLLLRASDTSHPPRRQELISQALAELQAARDAMVLEVS